MSFSSNAAVLLDAIARADEVTDKLSKNCKAIRQDIRAGHKKDNTVAHDLLYIMLEAEKLALAARSWHHYYCTMVVYNKSEQPDRAAKEVMAKAAEVTSKKTPFGYQLTLPFLLGVQKNKSRFVTQVLDAALAMQPHPGRRMKDCVVAIGQIYESSISQNIWTDNDNNTIRPLLNILKRYYIVDDDASCCQLFQYSRTGDSTRTRIDIINRKDFGGWLSDFEANTP